MTAESLIHDILTDDDTWGPEGAPDPVTLARIVDALEPVGAVEIADRLHVERGTVDAWRQRGVFTLEPTWVVGGRPAWAWGLVERWALRTGRWPATEGERSA